jgi:UDP-3-O-[3-hydroxymyristoyl] glucosamine N-acyltransferase
LISGVTLCHGVEIGERVLIHPGAVIGADGFGLAKGAEGWQKIPQLGSVRVGDDVEIGANTTVDRGAIRDTIIERGAKLDNQIQIAHNVRIGEHTAIAACVGISGSTTVGKHCTLGGGVGLAGHLEFGDNTHFTGQSLVTRSFSEPGLYSGNMPALPSREWRKAVARFRHLDEMARKISRLERQIQEFEGRTEGD